MKTKADTKGNIKKFDKNSIIHEQNLASILRLFMNNIKKNINQLSAFSIMTFPPIIPSTRLPKQKVIKTEDL